MKNSLNVLRATDLEKLLGTTIYNRNRGIMDEYIISNVKAGTFSTPVIQVLAPPESKLGKKLIDLYNKKVVFEDVSGVSDEMKILQASAFDGLVVGINMEKDGEMAIYTANPGAIFGIDNESKFSIDKTVELNRIGVVNAVRVDVTYTSEKGFEFKIVSLNKNTRLHAIDLETGEGKFYLVPYIAIQRSMVFFKDLLDDGRTLEVTQEVGGLNKVRYISTRSTELAKYTDSKDFADSLKAEYFPMKGFFYAPVLGASSMTAGRTRIEIINISNIKVTTKPKVQKAEDGLATMMVESVIQKVLTEIYNNDIGEYAGLVEKFPKVKTMFDSTNDAPSPVMIMKYYHQLKGKDLDKFHGVMLEAYPDLINEAVAFRKDIINRCDRLNPEDYSQEEMKALLKEGVYKFIIRKKDCEYSSMVVTNNDSFLKKMYGGDYFGKYESLGTRLYKLEEMVSKDDSLDGIREALVYCGLECFDVGEDTTVEQKVAEIMSTDVVDASKHDRLANLFKSSETKGKGVRRSSSNASLILVRKCFATLSGSGALDYYRYLDISKVTDMYRVG